MDFISKIDKTAFTLLKKAFINTKIARENIYDKR